MIIVKNRKIPKLADCKETYTGRQCVDNEEAERTFTFLEGQMNTFSKRFSEMCRKVTYSIFASSWATIFASKNKEFRFLLFITILLCILFLIIEIIYSFKMERFSRKLHYKFEHGDINSKEVDNRWNTVSDSANKWLQSIKLVLIAIMVIILAFYYFLSFGVC